MTTEAGVERLNALPRAAAVAELLQCCGARAWAETMADARPFGDREQLMQMADEVWRALPPADILEAFRAHPRIGERATPAHAGAGAAAGSSATAGDADVGDRHVGDEHVGDEHVADRRAAWSEQEQAGARAADREALSELARLNRVYEERFGHIFLICATGLDAATMLAALRARLGNGPDEELRIAAEEQRRITLIRLEKLL